MKNRYVWCIRHNFYFLRWVWVVSESEERGMKKSENWPLSLSQHIFVYFKHSHRKREQCVWGLKIVLRITFCDVHIDQRSSYCKDNHLSCVIPDKQSFISLFQVIFDLDFNCSNSQSDNLAVKVITFLTWKVLSFCSVIMKFLFVTLIDGLILEWYNDSYKPIGQKRVCSQLYPFCIVVKKNIHKRIYREILLFSFLTWWWLG